MTTTTLVFVFATTTLTFHVERSWSGDDNLAPLFDRAEWVTRSGSVTTLTYGSAPEIEAALQKGVRVGNRILRPSS